MFMVRRDDPDGAGDEALSLDDELGEPEHPEPEDLEDDEAGQRGDDAADGDDRAAEQQPETD
jgi:hypothetical protein